MDIKFNIIRGYNTILLGILKGIYYKNNYDVSAIFKGALHDALAR